MARYSLAKYILSIGSNDPKVQALFKDVKIGGQGNAVGSISVDVNGTLWSTNAYATGAYVHNKSLDRTGTVTVSINQLSAAVQKFITFVSYFYSESQQNDIDGVTITITDSNNNVIATCEDCLPTKIPTQEFGNSAGDQRWNFTCGKVSFI